MSKEDPLLYVALLLSAVTELCLPLDLTSYEQ